jgi:PiT family inorganic phosphate transporter
MEHISFLYFWEQMITYPILMVAVLLTLAVIFVNGWTDAPNAIATCVSTRCIQVNWAIVMAAVCNFLGVIIISLVNTRVAMTIKNMVNFQGDTKNAMIALCAAMAAIVIWAIGAWYFGIPTSESHALIAGLSGAAIALQGGLSGINGAEWVKVIYGLLLSTVLGFGVGFLICKGITVICGKIDRRKLDNFFTKGQIVGGAAMAFMHGAQDGQKFIGVLLLALYLVNDMDTTGGAVLPVWMMVLCSIIMGVGTSIGGKKIIKSVGMDMVKLEKYQGFSADVAASFGIFLSTMFGIPVSTTHMKTTAIMGVGAVKRMSAINYGVVKDMVLTWVLTFPGCGLIGFFMAKLFLYMF